MTDAGDDRALRSVAPTPLCIFFLCCGVAAALVAFVVEEAAVVSAFLLAVLVLDGLHTLRQLRSYQVSVRAPSRVFAARPFRLRVDASVSAVSRDVIVRVGVTPRSVWTVGYLPLMEGSRRCRLDARHRVASRGRYHELWVQLATTFPLGLFEVRVTRAASVELLALPAVSAMRGLEKRMRRAERGAQTRARRSWRGDEEFHSLRAWRAGESSRRVAWKASAKRGALVVREDESPRRRPVRLVLDPTPRRSASFELAVRVAASVADQLVRAGYPVHLLITGDADGEARSQSTSAMPILERLATVKAAEPDKTDLPPGQPSELTLLVRTGGLDSGSDEPKADLVFDVDDPATRRWLAVDCGIAAGVADEGLA